MSSYTINPRELRFIQLKGQEIEDFVWKLFRKSCYDLLDVPLEQESVAFGLRWDKANDDLELYAVPIDTLLHVKLKNINDYLEDIPVCFNENKKDSDQDGRIWRSVDVTAIPKSPSASGTAKDTSLDAGVVIRVGGTIDLT